MTPLTAASAVGSRCPLCANLAQPLFRKYGYGVQGCGRCGHRFVAPPPTPEHLHQVYDDSYFHGGGAGYTDYLAEARLLRHHGQRYARLLGQYMPPGRLLDVGAAAGFILQGFIDRGWQGTGVEPNAGMAAYGQTQLGLPIQVGALEQFCPAEPLEQFDLITMIQVIPHFFELRQALQRAAELTRPGGFWLIETWNRSSWTARLLGTHWHEYSPPSVLHWFAPSDLRLLVGQYGFVPIAQGRPQKWINAAHGKSLLRYKLRDMGQLGRWAGGLLPLIPDGLSLPYLGDDIFWLLVQKRSP